MKNWGNFDFLDELDDVQNIFTNVNFKTWINEGNWNRPWIEELAILEEKKVLGVFEMPVMAEGKNKRQLNSG